MAVPYIRRLTNLCMAYRPPDRQQGQSRAISVSTVDDNRIAIALYARDQSGVEHEDMGFVLTRAGVSELRDVLTQAVGMLDSEP